ncbi:MAG: dTDP-4-dehydrorhamnose reductase [Bacillota bacterium]
MKVLICGASGMLGSQVVKEYKNRGYEVFPLTRKEMDITSYSSVKRSLLDIKPHLAVNCAGYTDVDRAETEKEEALAVNGLGPRLLAAACRRNNAALVHISTDHVFNGQAQRPYLASDLPDPINTYGASKLMGEQAVRESGCRYFIVRTSWLFGPGGKKSFADTILSLAGEKETLQVVDDQHGNPTYTADLAKAIADLSRTGIYGTYHCTNSGTTSRYQFARRIIETAGLKSRVEPCKSDLFPLPARRPAYSALDPFPLNRLLGRTPPPWEEAVEHYIKII